LLRCCTGRRNSTLPHSESLSRRRKPYPFTKRLSEDVLERVRSRLRPIDCRGPGRPHRAAGREECSPCNLLDELLLFARARHIRINNHKMYLLTICLHDFLSCRHLLFVTSLIAQNLKPRTEPVGKKILVAGSWEVYYGASD